jgi:hypothetical protein
MLTTSQGDVLSHLHGVKVSDEGVLKPDWSSFWLPDFFQTKESLTANEQSAGNAFFSVFSKIANRPISRLWSDRNLAAPTGQFVDSLALALIQAGAASNQDAQALASYAGGAAYAKGYFGISNQSLSPSEYLDPENLVDAIDRSVNIGAALNRLKVRNPLAHKYVVSLVGAKAAKKKVQDQIVLAKETQKMIDKELQIASNIATGIGDTLQTGSWLVSKLPWILGLAAVGIGYYAFRKRGAIDKAITTRIGLS